MQTYTDLFDIMTSYIRITKVCQHCANDFIAKTTMTKYCGDNCAKRAYKERKKIKASFKEATKQIQRPITELQAKEYLFINEICQIFNVRRSTVYRLVKDQKIKAAKGGTRVIIRKSDLNQLFI